MSVLWKGRGKHPVLLMSMQVLKLTDLVKSYVPSHEPVLRGKTYQQGIVHRVTAHLFPFVYLGCYYSPSSPSLPPPTAMFFLFCSTTSSYLRRATRENNAASCFVMQWQTGFLCAVIRPPFLQEQTSPVADSTAIPRAGLTGNQATRGWCHFPTAVSLCDQYWLQKVKAKKVSFASLSKGSLYFFRCWSDKTINWPCHQISAIALVSEIITDRNDGKNYKSKL